MKMRKDVILGGLRESGFDLCGFCVGRKIEGGIRSRFMMARNVYFVNMNDALVLSNRGNGRPEKAPPS